MVADRLGKLMFKGIIQFCIFSSITFHNYNFAYARAASLSENGTEIKLNYFET